MTDRAALAETLVHALNLQYVLQPRIGKRAHWIPEAESPQQIVARILAQDNRTEAMKPEYEPRSANQAIAYLCEECGEVLAAAGKSLRWGLESVNPELPEKDQESNRLWLLREMKDLAGAVKRVREWLAADVDEDGL